MSETKTGGVFIHHPFIRIRTLSKTKDAISVPPSLCALKDNNPLVLPRPGFCEVSCGLVDVSSTSMLPLSGNAFSAPS